LPIAGIGIDLVHIERIEKLWDTHGESFLTKSFTEAEIETCKPNKRAAEMFAARFAAKEALMKAFGSGLYSGVNFGDIEIVGGLNTKPEIKLHGKIKDLADESNISKIFVSMTHEKEYAAAVVVLETK